MAASAPTDVLPSSYGSDLLVKPAVILYILSINLDPLKWPKKVTWSMKVFEWVDS